MVSRKETAFARVSREPPARKKTRFPMVPVLLSSAFLMCAQPNHAAAKANPKTMLTEKSTAEPDLQLGERVVEKRSNEKYNFVLTNMRFFVMAKDKGQGPVIFIESRKDLSKLISKGIVDWEVSENYSFFLTADKKLTVIPHNSGKATTYFLDFETAAMGKNRMIYHSGFLFIAPRSGKIMVCSDKLEWGTVGNPFENQDAGFSVSGNKLTFGNREIKIRGNELTDVRILR